MYKFEIQESLELGEKTYVTKLKNGLTVYICKKDGFSKKIGMYGTKYGSLMNEFVDIKTNKRIKVPDGIAHFLEHKLFEKEGANALDLFSKMGVSSNAYTSFDHTVYYFETIEKFNDSIDMLVKLIKEPYFTDENVEKEQGIIGQEISMYDDDPGFMVYFNALRAMYKTHPIRIDIAGTIDSISHITKELLYTCYNTFYSPQNMFFLVVGDVDVEKTVQRIENNIKKYEKDYDNLAEKSQIEKYIELEDRQICEKRIEQKMDIHMPQLCIGYKLDVVTKEEILKREVICNMISDMFFSKLTPFFEKEYNDGKIVEPISFDYEGSKYFSHIIISSYTTKINELEKDIIKYINEIKNLDIDEELFELIKRKKIGSIVSSADNLNISYRRIIESILDDTPIYQDIKSLNEISVKDIKEFLNLLDDKFMVVSRVISK
ncbi:MAG: pitrilysin family protein [Clostridia bacterium]|nr:pitrilysin family protein [Clostridia bacterium]